MGLGSLASGCGNKIPGTFDYVYVCLKEDIPSFPSVKTVTDYGDDKVLDGAFTMSDVVGKGYFRKIPILVNTGEFSAPSEGEVGGKKTVQRWTGFVRGFDPAEAKWFDEILDNDGCLIALVPYKANPDLLIVMGDLENGCYVENAEGGSGGDRVGKLITLYCDTGRNPLYYEVSNGVDITPATAP